MSLTITCLLHLFAIVFAKDATGAFDFKAIRPGEDGSTSDRLEILCKFDISKTDYQSVSKMYICIGPLDATSLIIPIAAFNNINEFHLGGLTVVPRGLKGDHTSVNVKYSSANEGYGKAYQCNVDVKDSIGVTRTLSSRIIKIPSWKEPPCVETQNVEADPTETQNNETESTHSQNNETDSTQTQNNVTESTQTQNDGDESTQTQNNVTESTQTQNDEDESTQTQNDSTQTQNNVTESTQTQNDEDESTQTQTNDTESTQTHNNEDESTQTQNDSTQTQNNVTESTQTQNDEDESTQTHDDSTQTQNNVTESSQTQNDEDESKQTQTNDTESTQTQNDVAASTQAQNNDTESTQTQNNDTEFTQTQNDEADAVSRLGERLNEFFLSIEDAISNSKGMEDIREKIDFLTEHITNLSKKLDQAESESKKYGGTKHVLGDAKPAQDQQEQKLFTILSIDNDKYFVSNLYQGHIYIASKETVEFNLHAINQECKDAGGYLVEFDDKDEQNFVRKFEKTTGHLRYYTGANDVDSEGTFVYFNSKKPVENVTWKNGEPNNSKGNENCVEIRPSGLYDKKCYRNGKYICEIPLFGA